MKHLRRHIAIACLMGIVVPPAIGQSESCTTTASAIQTVFSVTEEPGDTNPEQTPGDGWGDLARWIFDFSEELGGELIEKVPELGALRNANFTLNLGPGAADTAPGNMFTDFIGIEGTDGLAIENVLRQTGDATYIVNMDLISGYNSKILTDALKSNGSIPFFYHDDAILSSAKLDLLWDGTTGWIPQGGLFQDASNWQGEIVPGEGDAARFSLGSNAYTVTFAENVSNAALLIEGDNVTFNLGGREYSLSSNQECWPVFTVGPTPGSGLTVTSGKVFNLSQGNAAVVSGEGSHITLREEGELHTFGLTVGDQASSSVTVETGGLLNTAFFGELGPHPGTEGFVSIVGEGAIWQSSSITAGESGHGTIVIEQGGRLELIGSLTLGRNPGSNGNLTVSGATFAQNNETARLAIGERGTGSFNLTAGASVFTEGDVRLGANAANDPSGMGSASITGGSSWAATGLMLIGSTGRGDLTLSGESLLATTNTILGVTSGGQGRALVEGPGTLWHNQGFMELGSAGLGVVRVLAGARVQVDGALRLAGGPFNATIDTNGGIFCVGSECEGALGKAAAKAELTSGFFFTDSLYVLSDSVSILADKILFTEGGFLGGAGPYRFFITNDGVINPGDSAGVAGTFHIDNGYEQSDLGALEIELGGPTPGVEHDVLSVVEEASLGGVLRVSILPGFEPAIGQEFTILTAEDIDGEFASVEPQEGLAVEVIYDQNAVRLMVLDFVVVPTAIEEESVASLPTVHRLLQNYPNPFNPQTVISYEVAEPAHVNLSVYDLLGREVRQLADGLQAAGRYEVMFEAGDLPSGVYVYRLTAGANTLTRRMLLLR